MEFVPDRRGIAALLRSPEVADALARAAEPIAERVRAMMPVQTGALRASVHVEQHHRSADGRRVAVRVVADADYAAAVEFGNSRVPGQAPMRRAVE